MAEDSQPTNRDLATELAQLEQAVELSGRAILPTSNDELLTSIVTAAARIFGAAGAAILLVDDDDEALVFRVAIGDDSQDLLGVRIPIDKGIAGYVAMTGQAIAVSNTEQDARFNKEFAKSVGYVPDSILATPLLSGDRVVGVMEVLDKIDAASFGMQDMEIMGLFAQQAALAIEQSQQLDQIGEALVAGLKQLAADQALPDSSDLMMALEQSPQSVADNMDLLMMAGLFNDLSKLGANERRAALKVLAAFGEIGQTRRRYG